eukprot:TRINITY_DN3021_c0_g2_i3.p1 TRINITY_DN3021_c0_g2~~TRINITY_DN3021_c0_g2_i3.p1  ORF type:complete len:151 (-),score=16.20 TRINITY_DN3021_c0_g2_i3:4-456(-)
MSLSLFQTNQKKTTTFHAHKVILALRSTVFKTQLFGKGFKETQTTHSTPLNINLTDDNFSPNSFLELLNFIYSFSCSINGTVEEVGKGRNKKGNRRIPNVGYEAGNPYRRQNRTRARQPEYNKGSEWATIYGNAEQVVSRKRTKGNRKYN